MAALAGMPTRIVAGIHWGFALFHAALAFVFLALPPDLKPYIVLPALAVQLLWVGVVLWWMRRAGLGFRQNRNG
jgi:UDP-GlcNAc:undecaprenyl-phosphate GlcNAc-1-phosphate transferase